MGRTGSARRGSDQIWEAPKGAHERFDPALRLLCSQRWRRDFYCRLDGGEELPQGIEPWHSSTRGELGTPTGVGVFAADGVAPRAR
jgi:hypothetical protein